MGQDIPISAVASGGVYHYKDGRTAPDTINILLEYPSQFTATFEATLAPGISGAALEFCGTEGRLWISRDRFEFYQVRRATPPPASASAGGEIAPPGGGLPRPPAAEPTTVVKAYSNLDQDHMRNFLDCVKSRKLPNGDVLIGHRSAQASHLGTLAYMQKRRIDFDPIREEILPF
jgi:hypothetical protein